MKFIDFPLHESILKGLDQAGFTDCTRVQELCIQEVIQAGRDVTVQSQTGTGKTAAFLLPIFQLLTCHEEFKGKKALVLAPTRELAVQIEEEAHVLGAFLELKMGSVYGGVGYGQQEDMLRSGVDLVIATPGRLMDFMDSRKINLQDFAFVVIDEADRLLDMGFYPDIKKILSRCVARDKRRTMLLSATMSTRVSNIAWEHMNDPVNIEIQAENITVDKIDQKLFHLSSDEKLRFLLGYLKAKNPSNALVFTNTKRKAEELAKRLEINGYPACFLMGDLAQKRRLEVINEVKQGKVKYLVATDVAARGLHIDYLDLVVNYDLPEDPENYVHRIGRTARAGNTGTAISFSCERYVYSLPAIEKYIGMKIPSGEVLDEMLVEDLSRGKRIVLSTQDEDDGFGRNRGGRPGSRSQGDAPGRRPRTKTGPVAAGTREFAGTAPAAAQGDEGRRPVEPGQGRNRKPVAGNAQGKPRSDVPPRSKTPTQGLPAPKTVEERLDYYRRKYGDAFVPTPELLERLKRDEERSHEQRNRAMASRGHAAAGQKAQRPHAEGRHAPAAPKAVKQKTPVAADSPAAPVVVEKKSSGGVLGWIRSLLRGKKQGS